MTLFGIQDLDLKLKPGRMERKPGVLTMVGWYMAAMTVSVVMRNPPQNTQNASGDEASTSRKPRATLVAVMAYSNWPKLP